MKERHRHLTLLDFSEPLRKKMEQAETPARTYTCPVCGSVSHNPNDVEQGYCGRCHDWTRGK